MTENKVYSKEFYIKRFEDFEKSMNGESKTDFHRLRKEALDRFKSLDFPTTKNEEWKYTDIRPLLKHDFTNAGEVNITKIDIEKHLIPGLSENLIVLVNGRYDASLSKLLPRAKGVIVERLANFITAQPEFFKMHYAKYAKLNNGFVALNAAFAKDGVVIFVPDGKVISDPIHILNFTGEAGKSVLAQPRNLIVMGKDSQVKLVESYHSINKEANLSNVVTEVINGEGSYVELYKIQSENSASYHVNLTQVKQQKNSNFTTYTVTLGGAMVRNDLNTVLDDEHIQANLYGLYILDESQHVDNHTLIDHAKPNCESRELYKGVLAGRSRGVFNGKVFVRKDAQKTNAYQSNKAMLLSKEASIDTKPQLEIYADDVKCSHGAAIGQLDEESVFYLRSRGIGEEQARAVLIRAFANDVFEEIKLEPLHEYLNKLVLEKLK